MGTEFAFGFIETSGWYTLAVTASMEAHLKNSIKKLPTVTVSDIARPGVGLNLLVSIVVSIALVLDDNDSRTLTK